MTQKLLERTVREWVSGNPTLGARTLDRLAGATLFQAADRTTEDVAEALILLAGRMEIADSRVW